MSDLSELFERDPCNMSDQDIGTIVIRMRQNQAQQELGVRSPVTTRPKKAAATKTADLLKDMGLL